MVAPVGSTTSLAATTPRRPDTVDVTLDQLMANPAMQNLFVMTLLNSMLGINTMAYDMVKRGLDDAEEG